MAIFSMLWVPIHARAVSVSQMASILAREVDKKAKNWRVVRE